MISWSMTINILGGLSLFLYGMKIMSEALQKVAGNRLRMTLKKITSNRFSGVFTGFCITAAIQSSSATTVMLVSFVNAGLMNLTQSLGVILGANIGTTVTGWLVAIFGFKVKIALFALPAITAGFFVRFTGKQRLTDWGEVLMGFGFLFFGLTIMKDALGDLKHSQDVILFMSRYRADTLISTLAVVGIGTAVTMVIQSSSATMALTLTLASQNLIDYPTCAALILGENIGTTITANLAAIGASTIAKRAARAHMLFNIFGVIWMMFFFRIFLSMVDNLVPGSVTGSALPDHLAAFHTLFNIVNTLIVLPFISSLAWLAIKIVPEPEKKEETHLTYISSNLINTPPLALEESKRELSRMSENVLSMLDTVMELFNLKDKVDGDVEAYADRVNEKERLVDSLEHELTKFLVLVIRNTTSNEISEEIEETLNAVNNLERIGDHGEILFKQIQRMHQKKLTFSDQALSEMNGIASKVKELLMLINENITKRKTNVLSRAGALEGEINKLRSDLRRSHIERLNQGDCDVDQGLVFIDMLSSFEKMGDHAFNIAQSISGVR
jgi:phosphate:Na+ symporter